ncbi:MAG: hypothetical protein H3Z51_04240 [archaeon]|nr:hypothetical protein [archaeon]
MIRLKKLQESFQWFMPIKQISGTHFIRGVALNVGQTRNLNKYSEDELKRAARTLIDKPFFYPPHANPPIKVGEIIDAEYEDRRIEYFGKVDDEVWNLIASGKIKHVSVDARYRWGEHYNGVIPHGLIFDGLSLVPEDVEPGDPKTSVIIDRLIETLDGSSYSLASKDEVGVKERSGKAIVAHEAYEEKLKQKSSKHSEFLAKLPKPEQVPAMIRREAYLKLIREVKAEIEKE